MSLLMNLTSDSMSRYVVGENYSTPQLKYLNNRVGMFMHIQQDDVVNNGLYDIESYYTENFDWDALATQVASIGYIDYIVFRAKVERGFCHWATQVQFNNGVPFTYNGVTVPQYGFDYDLGNPYYAGIGVTTDTIDRFMTAFKAVGITPGIDYPIGGEHNVRTLLPTWEDYGSSIDPAIYGKYEEYHEYVKAQLIELVTLYQPEILWLDNEQRHPQLDNDGNDVRYHNYDDLYYSIKAIKKDIIIMGNLSSPGGLTIYEAGKIKYFPQDVASFESHIEPPDVDYPDAVTHDGSPYKLPKERLWDGLFNDSSPAQYAWWDTNSPDSPAGANQIRTQQDFQDAYDRAILLGATPNINIGTIPSSVGGLNKHLIDPTYLERLQNLVL